MTSTLAQGRNAGTTSRARDWAEIQERMLVPLYEAVYERLEVGPGTRLLGLGCGTGLALLMAAVRGAAVTGCDLDEQRLALARERLLPDPRRGAPQRGGPGTRLLRGGPERLAEPGRVPVTERTAGPMTGPMAGLAESPPAGRPGAAPFTMVTALDPAVPAAELGPALRAAARLVERGSPVLLAGWGPPERCATARVLAESADAPVRIRLSGRDDLEELALGAGLRPDGSGRVACPFAYPDMDSAVRGLLSTGLFVAAFDTVGEAGDRDRAVKELAEALDPYRRPDGTVRMENVFRYLVARA